MRDFINYVYEKGAVLFPPASPKAIKFVNRILHSHGFSALPTEYEEFLKLSDGMSWDGIEFAGTRSEERKEFNYNFPGLIELNLDFMSIEALRGKLLFGRAAEELFAYDTITGKYIMVDRLDLFPHTVFSTLEAMLKHWST